MITPKFRDMFDENLHAIPWYEIRIQKSTKEVDIQLIKWNKQQKRLIIGWIFDNIVFL